jgi:hypothetical protein
MSKTETETETETVYQGKPFAAETETVHPGEPSPKNWLELRLSEEEEKEVRAAAAIYKTVHLDTIDNVFEIARAIGILQQRYYGSGIRGDFGAALVQYGFTARDGSAMNKAIRSHLKELREKEAEVRKWWSSVPERKKRDWLSASAVWKNWKKSRKPPPDPNAPRRLTPLQAERATNVILQEQLRAANERLKTADGRDLFDIDHDSAEAIGKTIGSRWRSSPSKLETLIEVLTEELKEARSLIRKARPRNQRRRVRPPTNREEVNRNEHDL